MRSEFCATRAQFSGLQIVKRRLGSIEANKPFTPTLIRPFSNHPAPSDANGRVVSREMPSRSSAGRSHEFFRARSQRRFATFNRSGVGIRISATVTPAPLRFHKSRRARLGAAGALHESHAHACAPFLSPTSRMILAADDASFFMSVAMKLIVRYRPREIKNQLPGSRRAAFSTCCAWAFLSERREGRCLARRG